MTKRKLTRQYLMSIYDDGSVKMTERKITRRTKNGRFTSDFTLRFRKPKVLPPCAICPLLAVAL